MNNRRAAAANNPNRKPLLAGENLLQSQLCKVLDFIGLPYFSIPNGADKSFRQQRIFKATGLKAGVPDMFIPRCTIQGYPGIFIEVKNGRAGKISAEQHAWHKKLQAEGYWVVIVRSLDDLYRILADLYPIEAARICNLNKLILNQPIF